MKHFVVHKESQSVLIKQYALLGISMSIALTTYSLYINRHGAPSKVDGDAPTTQHTQQQTALTTVVTLLQHLHAPYKITVLTATASQCALTYRSCSSFVSPDILGCARHITTDSHDGFTTLTCYVP